MDVINDREENEIVSHQVSYIDWCKQNVDNMRKINRYRKYWRRKIKSEKLPHCRNSSKF